MVAVGSSAQTARSAPGRSCDGPRWQHHAHGELPEREPAVRAGPRLREEWHQRGRAERHVVGQHVPGESVYPGSGRGGPSPVPQGRPSIRLRQTPAAPSVVSPLQPDNRCRYDPSPYVSLVARCRARPAWVPLTQSDGQRAAYAEASYRRNKQELSIQLAPISDQFNLPPGHPLCPNPRRCTTAMPGSGYRPAVCVHDGGVEVVEPLLAPTATVQSVTGGSTPDILIRYRAGGSSATGISSTRPSSRAALSASRAWPRLGLRCLFLYGQTKLTENYRNVRAALLERCCRCSTAGKDELLWALTRPTSKRRFGRRTSLVTRTRRRRASRASARARPVRVAKLPAGSLAIALGAEWRKERVLDRSGEAMQIGDIATATAVISCQ